LLSFRCHKGVDGRDKPGHDGCCYAAFWPRYEAGIDAALETRDGFQAFDVRTGVDHPEENFRFSEISLDLFRDSGLHSLPSCPTEGAYPDRLRRGAGSGGRGGVRRDT